MSTSDLTESERNKIRDSYTIEAQRIMLGKYSEAAKDIAVKVAVEHITKEVPARKEREV